MYTARGSQRRDLSRVTNTDREKKEKEDKLTAKTQACSEKPKEDQSGRISPVFMEEEEDAPVCVVEPSSIPSVESDNVSRCSS
jgi:hypothetical protein